MCASQWAVLPVIPAAWLAFGFLLMAATVVTKHAFQPPLYAHRPILMFGCEFFRWWLVQRMVGLTTVLFADQLRGTPFLVWWFRALVRAPSLPLSTFIWMLPRAHACIALRNGIWSHGLHIPSLSGGSTRPFP